MRFKITELKGGYTNKIYRCKSKENKLDFIVRINDSPQLVNREQEMLVLQILSEQNISPPIFSVFENGYIIEYVKGAPIQTNFLKIHVAQVVKKMCDYHKGKIEYQEPWLNATINQYFSKAVISNPLYNFIKITIDSLHNIIQSSNSFLTDIVLCHNDLNKDNILYNFKTNTINFIDFEYTGMNYRGYDIANHLCEHSTIADHEIASFLGMYIEIHKRHNPDFNQIISLNMINVIKAFMQFSHILWILWSFIKYKETNDIKYYDYLTSRLSALLCLKN
jgi:thiamine kinase-like enzyme